MTHQEIIFKKRTGVLFSQFAEKHIVTDHWFIRKFNINISYDDCQDITQMALSNILETIEAYNANLSNLETWYYNILVNCIKANHTYDAKYQPISIDIKNDDGNCYADLLECDYSFETQLDKIIEDKIKSEKYYKILEYIKSLEPSRYKEIVIAYHLDNLKYDEITQYMNVKIETVKNDLFKFRKLCKRIMVA